MSAVRAWVGVLLTLQNAPDEATAQLLIARLADPHMRKIAQREWRQMQDAAVTTWATS